MTGTRGAVAVGIDVGGSKIETGIFGPCWQTAGRWRVASPGEYGALVGAVVAQLCLAGERAGPVPAGISLAGLTDPATGCILATNLPLAGRPFLADVMAASGRRPVCLNDGDAMVLSEAVLGAGRGKSPVAGLILGTGVGGGVALDGRLAPGHGAAGGEFGHIQAPARLLLRHGLPVVRCGCGRDGCIETCVSGAGLTRIGEVVAGCRLTPPEIAVARVTDARIARVWDIWCELVADLLMTLGLTVNPEVIVLGGGLSRIPGLVPDLVRALGRVWWPELAAPALLLAEGGDASGARGAALAAFRACAGEGRAGEEAGDGTQGGP